MEFEMFSILGVSNSKIRALRFSVLLRTHKKARLKKLSGKAVPTRQIIRQHNFAIDPKGTEQD